MILLLNKPRVNHEKLKAATPTENGDREQKERIPKVALEGTSTNLNFGTSFFLLPLSQAFSLESSYEQLTSFTRELSKLPAFVFGGRKIYF